MGYSMERAERVHLHSVLAHSQESACSASKRQRVGPGCLVNHRLRLSPTVTLQVLPSRQSGARRQHWETFSAVATARGRSFLANKAHVDEGLGIAFWSPGDHELSSVGSKIGARQEKVWCAKDS